MMPIKFASLVLGLLFVLHALRDSSAHAHQSRGFSGGGLTATGENVAAVQKELLERITAADSWKKGLGGRKMVVDKVQRKGNENEEGLHGETPKISGKDMNASKKSLGRSQDNDLIDQKNGKKLEPQTLESAYKSISRSETVHLNINPHDSQDSKAFSTKASSESSKSDKQVSQEPHDDIAHKDETKKLLLEADKEIVSLLHKDYRGMGKPRRKPPINNHKPTD